MVRATAPERTEELRCLLGDPQRIAEELRQARRSGEVLSSDRPRLLDEYEGKWIALHDGDVVGAADSIEDLLQSIDPAARSHVLVRYMDRDELTLIL
jgi:hypothetical protein